MAKRRKLSKDYEKLIAHSVKEIELILAKINDIEDDDIRIENTISFSPAKVIVAKMVSSYKEEGFTDNSDNLYSTYLEHLEAFKREYEI